MSVPTRARPVTAAELPALPACTENCSHHALVRDGDWAVATEDRFGWCGVRLCQDGTTVGYLLLAAPGLAPLTGPYLTTPMSPDAAVLVRVWVDPDHRRQGVGRQLVQRAAAAAHRAGVPAIEAIAGIDSGTCVVPPLRWLRRAGFVVTRHHPLHPRVRLALDRTVRVPHWSVLVDRVRALVRGPQAPPQPTGRTTAARTVRHDAPS